MREFGPVRKRNITAVDSIREAEARVYLGELKRRMAAGNLSQGRWRVALADGTLIEVSSIFGRDSIEIIPEEIPEKEEEKPFFEFFTNPLSDSAPSGWGPPFSQDNAPMGSIGGTPIGVAFKNPQNLLVTHGYSLEGFDYVGTEANKKFRTEEWTGPVTTNPEDRIRLAWRTQPHTYIFEGSPVLLSAHRYYHNPAGFHLYSKGISIAQTPKNPDGSDVYGSGVMGACVMTVGDNQFLVMALAQAEYDNFTLQDRVGGTYSITSPDDLFAFFVFRPWNGGDRPYSNNEMYHVEDNPNGWKFMGGDLFTITFAEVLANFRASSYDQPVANERIGGLLPCYSVIFSPDGSKANFKLITPDAFSRVDLVAGDFEYTFSESGGEPVLSNTDIYINGWSQAFYWDCAVDYDFATSTTQYQSVELNAVGQPYFGFTGSLIQDPDCEFWQPAYFDLRYGAAAHIQCYTTITAAPDSDHVTFIHTFKLLSDPSTTIRTLSQQTARNDNTVPISMDVDGKYRSFFWQQTRDESVQYHQVHTGDMSGYGFFIMGAGMSRYSNFAFNVTAEDETQDIHGSYTDDLYLLNWDLEQTSYFTPVKLTLKSELGMYGTNQRFEHFAIM